MSDELLAGDPADESAAAASVEGASDDADAAAAEDQGDALSIAADEAEAEAEAVDIGAVADLLAGAVISGNSQASAAALAEYDKLGRAPLMGGPIKVEVPVEDVAPTSELEQDQAAKAEA